MGSVRVRWGDMHAQWRKERERARAKSKKDRDPDRPEGPTEDDMERWRWLMDPDQVDPQEFQHLVFEVKTAGRAVDPDLADEDDDGGIYQPFRDRPAQDALWQAVLAEWQAGRGAKINDLKARQHGISTKVQAMMAERVVRHIGDGTTVCQDDDATLEMHSKCREFLSQIPDWAQPKRIKDRDRVVRFDHGGGRTSSVRVLTAGKQSLGRSLTNHWLHVSEYPFWPANAKKQLPGLLKTFHNFPGNFAILEWTANGYEQAYKRWMRSIQGKGTWKPLFLSWLMHPDYCRDFESQEAREEFEATIGTLPSYGGEEEVILMREHGASVENLHFRRLEIDGDLEGNLDLFHQEFPTVWQEAFIATGRPVLQPDTLRTWIELADEKEQKAVRSSLEVDQVGKGLVNVRSKRDRRGGWMIYEEPVLGQGYTFGCDVAGQYEVYADGSSESDKSVVDVVNILTGVTVAQFRGNLLTDDLAYEILKAAFWYGRSRGHIERNQDGGAVISALEKLTLGGFDGEDAILYQERVVAMDGTKGREAGFKTTPRTKKHLIAQLQTFIKTTGERASAHTWKTCPYTPVFIGEGMGYVYTRIGGMQAEDGFDDTVIAKALAILAMNEITDGGLSYSVVEEVMLNPLEAHCLRLAGSTDNAYRQKVDEMMGGMF